VQRPTASGESSVGHGVPAQIRDKIIKGEFIDINSLLETGQVVSEQQKMSLVNGELVFQQVQYQSLKLDAFDELN
jgi:hypothetical protein